MRAYLVRVAETKKIVGFFTARCLPNLIDLVEECAVPKICEFALVTDGGFYWQAGDLPRVIGVNADAELDMKGVWISGGWSFAGCHPESLRWYGLTGAMRQRAKRLRLARMARAETTAAME